MKYLTQEQVVNLNKVITAKTGGFSGKVRDNMSFWTAYFSPYGGAFNEEIYKSDIEKIARACYSFITNHPFTDGNKRIGIHLMLILLKINNYNVKFETDELVNIGISVAQNKMKTEDLVTILRNKI